MNQKYVTTEAYIYAYLQEEMSEEEKSIFIKDIQLDESMYEEYIEIRVRYYLLLLRKEEVGILSSLETKLLQKEKLFFQENLPINHELQAEYTIQLGQHKAVLAQKLKTSYTQNSPYIKKIIANMPQEEIAAAMKPSWYHMLSPYRYLLFLLLFPFVYWLYQININNPTTNSQDSTKISQPSPTEQLLIAESPKTPTIVNNDSLKNFHEEAKEQLGASENAKTPAIVNNDSKKNFHEGAKEELESFENAKNTTTTNESIEINTKYDNLVKLQEGVCYYIEKWVEYDKKHTTSGMANPNFNKVKECEAKVNAIKQLKSTWNEQSLDYQKANYQKIVKDISNQEKLIDKELNKNKKACSERGIK